MVSLVTTPRHILIEILKKLNLVPYFRIRRTCSFIYEIVLKEQHRFRIPYSSSFLDIKYDPKEKQRLKFSLCSSVYGKDREWLRYEYRNISKTASSLLAGLVFDRIFFIPIKHMYYSAEDWLFFESDMRRFTKTTSLKCGNIQIGARFKHFPRILHFFETAVVTSYGSTTDENDRNDVAEYPSIEFVLDLMEKPGMKHVNGLSINTEGRYESLVPLVKRLQYLESRENEYYYNLTEETPLNVNRLFREIMRGSFDHETKQVTLEYESKTEFYRTETDWKSFLEFQNIPHTVIWQKQHYEYNGYSNRSLLLIETNGSTTICKLEVGGIRSEYISVSIDFILLPTFNPSEIALFVLDNVIAARTVVNAAVLLNLIEKRDWTDVAEIISWVNKGPKTNKQCKEEKPDNDFGY